VGGVERGFGGGVKRPRGRWSRVPRIFRVDSAPNCQELQDPLVNSYIHIPTQRRRTAPGTPIDLALIRLLRSAMDLNWAPGTGVPAVLDAVDGSPCMLRHARVRLLRRLSDYPTEIGGRALATLAVALTETGTPMSGPDRPTR
jgi:hypothetical protein